MKLTTRIDSGVFVAGVLLLVLSACSSTKVTENVEKSFLSEIHFDQKTPDKRLIIKFEPEVPPYEVAHNKENRLSEIRFKCRAKESIERTYVFSAKGGGIQKAQLIVDAEKQSGQLLVWHDLSESYSLNRESATELVLANDDKNRQIAMLRAVDKTKRRVNLNVKGAPLDKIIRTLAAESNRSLVLGSSVGGTVSVTLNNMPYEQAIDMILRPTAYRAEHAGEVTIIRSAREDKAFRAFRLKYIDVTQAITTVKEIASKDGQVSADSNTNSIFVVDRFEILKHIESMLTTLDQEPRQVEVEAAILEMDSTNNLDVGFDFTAVVRNGQNSEVTNDIRTSKLSPLDSTLAGTKGTFVGLSWQSVRGILGMLSSKGKLNLLARPRVLAVTDQEASIILGSKLGYKTVTITQNGVAEDIKFLTVGTQLKIKPHITMNNDILMYIKPEISDGVVDARTGIPSANTTTSETKVLARNGQTIIIGGLLRDRVEKKADKIPILGDIPVLGFFFSGNTKTALKSEVMILLSPKLVTNELQMDYERQSDSVIERFKEDSGLTLLPSRITE